MKVLQVIHGFLPYNTAGTEVHTYNLSTELSKRNNVSIFHRVSDFETKEYTLGKHRIDTLEVFVINNTFRNYDSFEMTYQNNAIAEKFREVLDRIKPDVVHIQHLLYLSTLIVEEAAKRNIPIVFTLHDYWLICPQGQLLKNNILLCENNKNPQCAECVRYQLCIKKNIFNIYYFLSKWMPDSFIQAAKKAYLSFGQSTFLTKNKMHELLDKRAAHMRRIASKIDCFIAPSQFIKRKFIESGIPEHKIVFLPLGLKIDDFKKNNKSPNLKLRLGFIGNLLPAKGVHILIKALNTIKKDSVELKIFGEAKSYKSILENYLKYIKSIARQNRNIKFMGGFNHRQITEIFNEIDVLIVPSIWFENSPLVILEAFATKTPVIGANIGGIPEFIKDGVNGLLFNAGDPLDLVRKIEYLLENPAVFDKFKKNIPEVKTIEENAEEIEGIYANLVSKKRIYISI